MDSYDICPLNSAHVIIKSRMPRHIIKCMKNYEGPPLAMCPYNAKHLIPKDEMQRHIETSCEDYGRNQN